ncbi:hypothetical protein AXF42_Ash000414 [Apostasia shenzhenica]|uniref:AAA+ ATPase domain-containing protein n=1 Tax=Apostasia shenzhenica TaxID=1088818 RepID=A0A2I0AG77_9ASPA|nr:hypothetical protein AXF42_Ash000414 [Apostasia shenzhenica]
MVEKCVTPSELHLKKELTALQRARFLRDPETCSSWRSPLSSKSLAISGLYHENLVSGISSGENIFGGVPEIPPRNDRIRKKVYLYNWRKHSGITNESGVKLGDDGIEESVESNLEERQSNNHEEEAIGEKFCNSPADIFNARDGDQKSPLSSTITRLKRANISANQARKHAVNTKHLAVSPSLLGALSSVEQSDDTEYRDSPSASPLSGAGCANWPLSAKLFSSMRREGSSHSCTPVSTSSYYRRRCRRASTIGSWGGTTASFEDNESDQLDLPVRQRCGLPCYWSKRTRDSGCGGCYSPSLSDTIKRKGGSILCGSQSISNKKRSSGIVKPKYLTTSQGLPLLTKNSDGASSDEHSKNIGELDLEALSRLDGRRWSSCKSQEAFESVETSEFVLDITDNKSLSLKHKPRAFEDVVGQNIVVQSLKSAISRGRIAPAYLFHGPNGTGKSLIARIFAAALNCLATRGNKPCGLCEECSEFYRGNESFVKEIAATNKKGIDRIRHVVKKMSKTSELLQYKIIIIDECHLLSSKMWSAFLRYLEEPISHVVFIFITTDDKNLPRAILSHCQKYVFSKIKDVDVILRLRKLSSAENIDIEEDALNLIAMNSEGSLQDAETILYQLSLLGKRITTTLVTDLVGFVSDEKLLDLLDVAMSSNTAETVKRSRELMNSGVDQMSLISQLAKLIVDIIAGTNQLAGAQRENVVLGGRSLTEDEVKRLQQALKVLSDAEKQLRHPSELSTWFTAALLQLVSGQNVEPTQPNDPRRPTNKAMSCNMEKCTAFCGRSDNLLALESSSAVVSNQRSKSSTPTGCQIPSKILISQHPTSELVLTKNQLVDRRSYKNLDYNTTETPTNLSDVWRSCIEKCYSKTLQKLLSLHGKLLSVTENEGILIAYIAFADNSIKLRAERYLSSITNSLEMVLRHNVEVRIIHVPDINENGEKALLDSSAVQHTEKLLLSNNKRCIGSDRVKGLSDKNYKNLSFTRNNRDSSEGEKSSSSRPQNEGLQLENYSVVSEGNDEFSGPLEKAMEIMVLKARSQVSNEQNLENAWLQDAEERISRLPLSKADNQTIQQSWGSNRLTDDRSMALNRPSKHWGDELDHEIKIVKISDIHGHRKTQVCEDRDHCVSPSLLHSNIYGISFDKENSEYESGPGCSGFFCWKTKKLHKQQLKHRAHPRYQKARNILLFGQRMRLNSRGSKSRR